MVSEAQSTSALPPSCSLRACIAMFVLVGGGWSARAAESSGPVVGSTVRISTRSSVRPLTGEFAGWQGDGLSMRLAEDGSSLAVTRGDIVRFEVQTRPSRRRKGALIGASVLAGAMGGLVLLAGCGSGECEEGRILVAVVGAAGVGAGLGAALAPGARWTDVPIGPTVSANRLQATLCPIRGGLSGHLRLSF